MKEITDDQQSLRRKLLLFVAFSDHAVTLCDQRIRLVRYAMVFMCIASYTYEKCRALDDIKQVAYGTAEEYIKTFD